MEHAKGWDVDRTDIIQKVTRRLIPFVGIIYLIAYIDRQNVSYAKLQMVGDLGLSEYAYGLGASLFFIGYFFFEVPSNVIMERVGARRWFARIMISWGLVTIALAYTQNTAMFYILRFLLGACEAGFFPGVLFLLTLWFPFKYRAQMVGSFMLFSAIANAIGAPIGGSSPRSRTAFLGMKGWQWVFIVTGIPAVADGLCYPRLPGRQAGDRALSFSRMRRNGCATPWRPKTAPCRRRATRTRSRLCSTAACC